jgi:hypothetical protein
MPSSQKPRVVAKTKGVRSNGVKRGSGGQGNRGGQSEGPRSRSRVSEIVPYLNVGQIYDALTAGPTTPQEVKAAPKEKKRYKALSMCPSQVVKKISGATGVPKKNVKEVLDYLMKVLIPEQLALGAGGKFTVNGGIVLRSYMNGTGRATGSEIMHPLTRKLMPLRAGPLQLTVDALVNPRLVAACRAAEAKAKAAAGRRRCEARRCAVVAPLSRR